MRDHLREARHWLSEVENGTTKPYFVGDDKTKNGVKWGVHQEPGGWFVDAEANAGDMKTGLTHNDGPYDSEEKAMRVGYAMGLAWCIRNGIELNKEDGTFEGWRYRNLSNPKGK